MAAPPAWWFVNWHADAIFRAQILVNNGRLLLQVWSPPWFQIGCSSAPRRGGRCQLRNSTAATQLDCGPVGRCPAAAISVKQGYTMLPALQVCSSMTRGGTPVASLHHPVCTHKPSFIIWFGFLFERSDIVCKLDHVTQILMKALLDKFMVFQAQQVTVLLKIILISYFSSIRHCPVWAIFICPVFCRSSPGSLQETNIVCFPIMCLPFVSTGYHRIHTKLPELQSYIMMMS